MKSPTYRAIGKLPPNFIAGFDSGTGFIVALNNFLRGEGFSGAGNIPSIERLAAVVNAMPQSWREVVYARGGAKEAVPPGNLRKIHAEEFARWVANLYPHRRYPAVMIGSPCGAITHLAAALGIPWLPQTFLIPIKRPHHLTVDEPKRTMEWSRKPAQQLLAHNPDWQIHHLFDPSNDRLMLSHMTYFRLKKRRLGTAYEQFITQNVEPGGTIFLVECERKWPTTRVDEGHYFQVGGLGATTREEYLYGGPRVAAFLKKYGSQFSHWDTPAPDADRPEAEWGFEPALREDVIRFARRHGFRVRRIVYHEPDHISPFVADFYREWYRQRRMAANRLVVESFITHEPYWTLRTGSVPFWMAFNGENSAEWAETYISQSEAFDEIFLMLFSHGTESIGLPPFSRWQALAERAIRKGGFIGVEGKLYPRDFGSFIRYHTEFPKKIAARYPMPSPLTLSQLDAFIANYPNQSLVQWLEAEV